MLGEHSFVPAATQSTAVDHDRCRVSIRVESVSETLHRGSGSLQAVSGRRDALSVSADAVQIRADLVSRALKSVSSTLQMGSTKAGGVS